MLWEYLTFWPDVLQAQENSVVARGVNGDGAMSSESQRQTSKAARKQQWEADSLCLNPDSGTLCMGDMRQVT